MILLLATALSSEPEPLVCCDEPAVSEQLKYYFKVSEIVAGGGTKGKASGQLYGWAPVAKKAAARLKGEDRAAMQRIAALTEQLKNRDLEAIRAGLLDLSRDLSFLVVRHPGGSVKVYEAHCGDRPWLQRDAGELRPPWPDCNGTWRVPAK